MWQIKIVKHTIIKPVERLQRNSTVSKDNRTDAHIKLIEAVKASTRPTQVLVSALRWGSRLVLTPLTNWHQLVTEKPTGINL